MPATSLPKTAPTIVDRPRLAAWLEFCALTPLRLIAAPAGAGKTTSAVVYARSRNGRCAYLKLAPGVPVSAFVPQLASAVGAPGVRGYDGLLAHLVTLGRTEIVIDDVDRAADETRDLLGRLFLDVPDGITFIYLARSVTALDISTAVAQGLAERCDDALLAFDEHEVVGLAASLGRSIDRSDARRLLEATHGWAIAIAGACRAAAAHGLPFDDALLYWRRTNDVAIAEIVADALDVVPERVRLEFTETLAGRLAPRGDALARFRRYGLFVTRCGPALAINPLLLGDPFDAATTDRDVAPAAIEMFGRFSFCIDGRTVAWQRRRDRQIVQFLAMAPHGRATRAELIATFWPEADPHLARQSLRTAFCTIRQAIGACAGSANVGRYFVADHVVELNLRHVSVSAHRFVECVERGQAAEAGNDIVASLAHYREAARLYRAPFLAGEPPMEWAAVHAERLARMSERVAQRLGGRVWTFMTGSRVPLDVA